MADNISTARRSKVMSTVRSKNSRIEQLSAAILEQLGGAFEHQPKGIKGRPDFADQAHKIVIFVDSCFWHGCPRHLRMPSSNQAYWQQKIAYNRRRDAKNRKALRNEGWHVVRIWEHELPMSPSLKGKLTHIKHWLESNDLTQKSVS